MGFYGVWNLYPECILCIPEGEARGNTLNCTKGTNPIHTQKPMVQLTCIMVMLIIDHSDVKHTS